MSSYLLSRDLEPITIGGEQENSVRRLVGGYGYDRRQPLPVTFPRVRNHFLNARANFWIPKEIPMGDDRKDWETERLSPEEEYLFKVNISYLTASDSLVPDNITNVLLPLVSNYEMQQYLRWQVMEESNHLEAYLYILEAIGLDVEGQGQIFNLYQEMPELQRKLNWSIYYSKLAASSRGFYNEDIVNIYLNIWSYLVFEFVFFPLGFAQVFALARNGKMKNSANQYQYIWRDETLHGDNELWMLKQLQQEHPLLKDAILGQQVLQLLDDAFLVEKEYAKASMPNGGIPGFSVNDYLRYARHLLNDLCDRMGMPRLYNNEATPLNWMSTFWLTTEANFFEGRVTEYRTGGSLRF
jgi:ribonucleoside-diphosphate reductase beta chain